ncbi:MAG TPA: DUF3299 domain-containing protein [Pirellulales bacterium]|jgi:hypothetical protein|nr:DUF3299 domain-containing protein [Pirellulales bacterium]
MIRPLPAAAYILVATLAMMLAACQESAAPGAPALSSTRTVEADASAVPAADEGTEPNEPAVAEANLPRRDITFDDLKFDIEKGQPFVRSMLTPKIVALDGRQVRIRGYILPSFQQTGLTQFVLVRDNLQCCFGPGAALYDCILVEMEPGRSADFTIRPVAVEGTLAIREYRGSNGKDLAVYHLDGQQVE